MTRAKRNCACESAPVRCDGQSANEMIRKLRAVARHPAFRRLMKEYETVPARDRIEVVSRTFCAEALRARAIPFPAGARAFSAVSGSEEGEIEICLAGDADNGLFQVSWDFGCLTIDIGSGDDEEEDDDDDDDD